MKFNFQLETEIDRPLEAVIRLFANREHLPQWQPGLVSSEFMESKPYLKYRLRFQLGKRKMSMMETITRNDLPKHYNGYYEMKGMRMEVHNAFESAGLNRTRWTCEVVYSFRGLMSLIAPFMKENFRKQSAILMKNFKGFCEHIKD
jgi:uncharacterized membrane protein